MSKATTRRRSFPACQSCPKAGRLQPRWVPANALNMNLNRFAQFFVRFNGLCFVFWALYDALDFPVIYQNYRTVHEFPLRDSFLAREFFIFVARLALQLLAAVVLLGRTDKVITFVLTGQWRTPAPDEAADRPNS